MQLIYPQDAAREFKKLRLLHFWANDDVNDEVSASEDSVLKQDDLPENSLDDANESDTVRYCAKGEPVSCYCSASHTDNISTDEHDSLRDSHASNQQQAVSKTLHLSDSGADLTADVSCSNSAWQKYWAVNGERLIWESWITKYSAYINPEYLQTNQIPSEENYPNEELPNQDKVEGSNRLKVSFDSLSPHQDDNDYTNSLGLNISLLHVKENSDPKPINEIVEKNRMLVRNLSYSDSYDKLNREIEGWNPLSPVSNDCETEAERLLSSQCASRTGSSARTFDSMTNVTRLTVSSIDLSESSKNTDSFSSVSSIQSSMTSTSSEDADEPGDHEHQWNVLWTKHYEQEYLEHYKKFLWEHVGKTTESTDEAAESINDCEVEDNFKAVETPKPTADLDEQKFEPSNKEILPGTPKTRRRKNRHRDLERKVFQSVGYALKNLKKIKETSFQEETVVPEDATHSCKHAAKRQLLTNCPELNDIVKSEALKMEKTVVDDSRSNMEIDLSTDSLNAPEESTENAQEKAENLESGYLLNTTQIEGEEDTKSNDCKSGLEISLPANSPNTMKGKTQKQQDVLEMEEIGDDTNDSYKFGMEIDLSPNCFLLTDSAGSETAKPHKSIDENLDRVLYSSKIEDSGEEIKNIHKFETKVVSPLSFVHQNENIESQSTEYLKTNVRMECVQSVDEEAAMRAMGVPSSFGHKKFASSKSKSNLSSARKRSFEEDNLDQSSSNRIKAAFTLLSIQMHEGQESKFKGSIEYKMKHIRSQNRHLQFKNEDRIKAIAPKHIHFDDDGEVISNISVSNEVTVQNSHQDELLGIIPSSSTENELKLTSDQGQIQEAEKGEESTSKKRKRKRKINIPVEIRGNPKLKKFWRRRYSLFSKFDLGIKLDEESWFSVTPELVAQHTAERCQCDIIIDAFCGAGGNSIQFARTCKKVIAIDIDAKKIELAQHNAQVYGIADRIEFIIGDFFELASTLQGDVVFLSPPWGGPQYRNLQSYDLELLQPAPFSKLFNTAKNISQNIVLFLPKNSNTYPLITASGSGGKVEIEQNFLGKRLIALTAYYGKLVKEVASQKNSKEISAN